MSCRRISKLEALKRRGCENEAKYDNVERGKVNKIKKRREANRGREDTFGYCSEEIVAHVIQFEALFFCCICFQYWDYLKMTKEIVFFMRGCLTNVVGT